MVCTVERFGAHVNLFSQNSLAFKCARSFRENKLASLRSRDAYVDDAVKMVAVPIYAHATPF